MALVVQIFEIVFQCDALTQEAEAVAPSTSRVAKVRDGFTALLKRPTATPIEYGVPQAVLDNMVMGARHGRKRRPFA